MTDEYTPETPRGPDRCDDCGEVPAPDDIMICDGEVWAHESCYTSAMGNDPRLLRRSARFGRNPTGPVPIPTTELCGATHGHLVCDGPKGHTGRHANMNDPHPSWTGDDRADPTEDREPLPIEALDPDELLAKCHRLRTKLQAERDAADTHRCNADRYHAMAVKLAGQLATARADAERLALTVDMLVREWGCVGSDNEEDYDTYKNATDRAKEVLAARAIPAAPEEER